MSDSESNEDVSARISIIAKPLANGKASKKLLRLTKSGAPPPPCPPFLLTLPLSIPFNS